jgi:dTDP-4-dehydrorhamnose reductase
MTTLVLGAGGQLGRALVRRLGAAAVGLGHDALSIDDADAVARALDAHRPERVVNAAAYTQVDRAEAEPEAAFRVNRDGPSILARACRARSVALLHVSTDYVFDGAKPGAWVETDATSPLGVYGASKLAGEQALLDADPDATVVRTSWVFSADGANFVKTILRLARERPVLRVVADQRGCPTHADDLARALLALTESGARRGVYHFCGDGPTTWHGFAETIVREAGLAARVDPIATAEYPTPARRPANSVLDTGKIRQAGITPAPWVDGLRAVVAELRPR